MPVPLCVDNVGAAGTVVLNQLVLNLCHKLNINSNYVLVFLKLSCSSALELLCPATSSRWGMFRTTPSV